MCVTWLTDAELTFVRSSLILRRERDENQSREEAMDTIVADNNSSGRVIRRSSKAMAAMMTAGDQL